MDIESQTNQIQSLLNAEVQAGIPGVLLHIESPAQKISWSWAAGLADTQNGQTLQADQQFRIASVTKTFVACAILRLWEEGRLKLDDPIPAYISAVHTALLRQGGYEVERITIRHVLRHASGLFDHTNSPNFMAKIMQAPDHAWTRTEQVEMAATDGKPIGPVGEQFSYSDTGYILLGEIVENLTGQNLHDSLAGLLDFPGLGLVNTWIETEKDANSQKRIHQYYEGLDTYDFSPTMDLYGGGGLLSTCRDLAIFFLALFSHKVFRKAHTLDSMLQPFEYSLKPDKDYRLGIWRIQIEGVEAFTHTGFWGTQVIYLPELNASVAANYSQIWPIKGTAPLIQEVAKLLSKVK